MNDAPMTIYIPKRDPEMDRPFPDDCPAWPTSVDGIVVAYTAGWSVTHQYTGMQLPGGPWCCLTHAREWVSEMGEVDWSFTTIGEWEQKDRQPYIDAVREAGSAWRCEDYAQIVEMDTAVAVVAHGLWLAPAEVREVLVHAEQRGLVELPRNIPEVGW